MTNRALHDAAMAAKRFHDAALAYLDRPDDREAFERASDRLRDLEYALMVEMLPLGFRPLSTF